eukprot:g354.t1
MEALADELMAEAAAAAGAGTSNKRKKYGKGQT